MNKTVQDKFNRETSVGDPVLMQTVDNIDVWGVVKDINPDMNAVVVLDFPEAAKGETVTVPGNALCRLPMVYDFASSVEALKNKTPLVPKK